MLIDGFSAVCNNIDVSYWNVVGNSMSVICFWTTSKGGLNHFYYIFLNPEPLSMDFKTVAFSITETLIFVEIHIWKERIKNRNYFMQLGATEACTKRMIEETKEIGQRYMERASKDSSFLKIGSPQRNWQNLL